MASSPLHEEDPFGACFSELSRRRLAMDHIANRPQASLSEVYEACKIHAELVREEQRKIARDSNLLALTATSSAAVETGHSRAKRARDIGFLLGPHQHYAPPTAGVLQPVDEPIHPVVVWGDQEQRGVTLVLTAVLGLGLLALWFGLGLQARFKFSKDDPFTNSPDLEDYLSVTASSRRSRCSVHSRQRRRPSQERPPVHDISFNTNAATANMTAVATSTVIPKVPSASRLHKVASTPSLHSLSTNTPALTSATHSNDDARSAGGSSHSKNSQSSTSPSQRTEHSSPATIPKKNIKQRQARGTLLLSTLDQPPLYATPTTDAMKKANRKEPDTERLKPTKSFSSKSILSAASPSGSNKNLKAPAPSTATTPSSYRFGRVPVLSTIDRSAQAEKDSDLDDIRKALQRYYKAYQKKTARRAAKSKATRRKYSCTIRCPLPSMHEEPILEELHEELDDEEKTIISQHTCTLLSHPSEEHASGEPMNNNSAKTLTMPQRRPSLGEVSEMTEDDDDVMSLADDDHDHHTSPVSMNTHDLFAKQGNSSASLISEISLPADLQSHGPMTEQNLERALSAASIAISKTALQNSHGFRIGVPFPPKPNTSNKKKKKDRRKRIIAALEAASADDPEESIHLQDNKDRLPLLKQLSKDDDGDNKTAPTSDATPYTSSFRITDNENDALHSSAPAKLSADDDDAITVLSEEDDIKSIASQPEPSRPRPELHRRLSRDVAPLVPQRSRWCVKCEKKEDCRHNHHPTRTDSMPIMPRTTHSRDGGDLDSISENESDFGDALLYNNSSSKESKDIDTIVSPTSVREVFATEPHSSSKVVSATDGEPCRGRVTQGQDRKKTAKNDSEFKLDIRAQQKSIDALQDHLKTLEEKLEKQRQEDSKKLDLLMTLVLQLRQPGEVA